MNTASFVKANLKSFPIVSRVGRIENAALLQFRSYEQNESIYINRCHTRWIIFAERSINLCEKKTNSERQSVNKRKPSDEIFDLIALCNRVTSHFIYSIAIFVYHWMWQQYWRRQQIDSTWHWIRFPDSDTPEKKMYSVDMNWTEMTRNKPKWNEVHLFLSGTAQKIARKNSTSAKFYFLVCTLVLELCLPPSACTIPHAWHAGAFML